ncbi:GNAT family N-acetyltransferase [Thermanaerosceptrum fracticalcis]|uniref:GNAT family N-acetyltransferase n=1 Tax=Thermanaerosceptrum fracticalcis TaxID=1712410 RepID=A0A7G6E3L0_THEFR|nr:GNAT family N-acetyltransferase [Thermanaerosceptrum fracticalcis]QNB46664.1 GNAT family N-acetyltransferase [Thermanaerosceptrum fracticalcis]
MIRKASVHDLDSIMAILKALGTNDKNPTQGFLMSDYTVNEDLHRKKYEGDLKTLTYTYVYEEETKVKGFLIAYRKDEWLKEVPSWEEDIFWHPQFNRHALEDFVLINQTGMFPGLTGKGIGSSLYQALFADLAQAGITNIFAETIIAPTPNFASLHFRIKQKYSLAGVRYEKYNDTIFTTLVYHKRI